MLSLACGSTALAGRRTAKSGTAAARRVVSLVSYHTRDIATAMMKADAWSLHRAAHDSRARLCALRAVAPAAPAPEHRSAPLPGRICRPAVRSRHFTSSFLACGPSRFN